MRIILTILPELEMHLAKKHNTELFASQGRFFVIFNISARNGIFQMGLGCSPQAEKHIETNLSPCFQRRHYQKFPQAHEVQLIENFEKYGDPLPQLDEVPYDKLSSYGIIKGKTFNNSLYVLEDIVSKSSHLENAPSTFSERQAATATQKSLTV